MTRILVIAPSWVGDAVMTLPMLERLHQRHGELELDVLAPPWTQGLFDRMSQVRGVVPADFAHGELSLRKRFALARRLKAARYDQAIVLPNSFKSALIPWLAAIPLRTGFVGEARWGLINDVRRLDPKALPMMVERFASLAEQPDRPLHRPLSDARLVADPGQRNAALTRLALSLERPVVVLCPGAEYGPAKRWPAEYFGRLARTLNDAGNAVWVLGSGKDAAISAKIQAESGDVCVDLCGKSTLSEAVDLLSCASLVISNDSGLMHIAAALDRPMIAIYGSSSPGFTPPLSEHAQIVSLRLPCSPCYERICPLGHFDCMTKLEPGRILERVAFANIKRS